MCRLMVENIGKDTSEMHNFETEDEYLIEAREELNRIEHIIYVSLKYTRTTDVLRNAFTFH